MTTKVQGLLTGYNDMADRSTTPDVKQNGHISGTFSSTAKAGTASKTRTSDYGQEYDLSMKAGNCASGPYATGTLGYYVNILNSGASKIQGAVDAAQDGDAINVATGNYDEDVNINKGLILKGSGDPTAKSFSLNAILGVGSGGIVAPIINVNPPAKIQDGVTLASTGGTVNVAAGTYNEDVNINKGLTLKGSGNPTTKSFSLNAILGAGSGGITAPIVNVNPSAKIQDGITLASSGGTVNVAEGTYKENVLIDKSLSLKGADADKTTVDGDKKGSVFTIGNKNSGVVVILSGITIKNGIGIKTTLEGRLGPNCAGGGIWSSARVSLYDAIISNNNAVYGGGGIYNKGTMDINRCSITLNDVQDLTIKNPTKGDGGGIYNEGTVYMNSGSIDHNTAAYGGGITNGGTLNLNGGSIDHNTARGYTGIEHIYQYDPIHDHWFYFDIIRPYEGYGGGIVNGGKIKGNVAIVHDNTPDDIYP